MEVPSIIKRPLPNAVIYDLSYSDHVLITLPTGSTWSSSLHWHEHHVEYLRVVKGKVRVRLGSDVQIFSAPERGDAVKEIRVEKNMRHEWSRDVADGEDVVVMERTEPQDGDKAIFFWNLNGVVLDVQAEPRAEDRQKILVAGGLAVRLRQVLLEFRITLELFTIFRSLDNFPVFMDLTRSRAGGYLGLIQPNLSNLAEWVLTHSLLEASAILALMWGIEPVRRKYTPEDAFRNWQRRTAGKPKHE